MEEETPTLSTKGLLVENHEEKKEEHEDPIVKRQKPFKIFRENEESLDFTLSKTPYPHLLIADIFDEDFIRSAIREIKDNSTVSFKESDLFRVFQSMDLANLSGDAKLPHVWDIRNLLYSNEWRNRIEKAFDLPKDSLTDQVDCACNCHTKGCHLLCHDDVIGTRCISYIFYLSEPDWEATEGGSLELFDQKDGIPLATPSKYILPKLNQLVCFKVEPTVSFHAVQEVRGDRPRLSLQGWYHTKGAPEQKDLATLARLKDKDENDKDYAFKAMDCGAMEEEMQEMKVLDAKDKEMLSAFIQDTYLDETAIEEIAEKFEADSSVQLRNFLKDDVIASLDLSDEDDKDLNLNTHEFDLLGVTDKWKIVGPPHKQRFLEHTDESSSLSAIRTNLLESPSFGRYVHLLTGLKPPTSSRGRTRRFRRGRDYTVAHYGQLLKDESVLDATLCFVKDDSQDEKEVWQSGDVGGFECYIEADDEDNDAPADEYNEDDDTELLSVSASNNTLSLVYRDPGTMRFIKYLGSKAPSSRWDIAMEYQVPQDDDNKEEENEEQENGEQAEVEEEETEDHGQKDDGDAPTESKENVDAVENAELDDGANEMF